MPADTPTPGAPAGGIYSNIVPFRGRHLTEDSSPTCGGHDVDVTNSVDIQEYGIEELIRQFMPPRSRLYSKGPIGIGTPLVESVTSFTMRLADAHGVTVGTLVQHEVAPRLRSYLYRDPTWNGSGLLCSRAYMLNGTQDLARDFVALLEELTSCSGLSVLTMQPWREVLSTQRLLDRHRVWCPVCLETWRLSGQVIYEPLLWQLQVVTHCPVHSVALRSVCPKCGLSMPVLASQTLPGQCSKCQAWLGSVDEQEQDLRPLPLTVPISSARVESGGSGYQGETNHEGRARGDVEARSAQTQHSCGSDREVWDTWAAEAVGEMLANPPARDKRLSRATLREAIAAHLEVGQFARFARAHGLRSGVLKLQYYYQGLMAPRIKTLLQICHGLNTRPLAFLTNDSTEVAEDAECGSRGDNGSGSGNHSGGQPPAHWAGTASRQPLVGGLTETQHKGPFASELIREELVALLADTSSEPPDLTAVARRLGYDRRQLYRAFPDLAQAIAQRYLAHRKEKRATSLLVIAEEVRQATRRCYFEGVEPTRRNVGVLLSKPGCMRMPQAREARETALRELALGS